MTFLVAYTGFQNLFIIERKSLSLAMKRARKVIENPWDGVVSTTVILGEEEEEEFNLDPS